VDFAGDSAGMGRVGFCNRSVGNMARIRLIGRVDSRFFDRKG
jgi:hypothetical protein